MMNPVTVDREIKAVKVSLKTVKVHPLEQQEVHAVPPLRSLNNLEAPVKLREDRMAICHHLSTL